ncbi:hypothetical protein [Metabacillus arenae]|uniref:Uncharacterized protein n=1 Tax=Metabacillus arenae TaxID=2771434 RepID=A0A926NJG4_9BACI|nr:hypothetical protein [Metabacillus arenae]MBD1381900.1 hypothetical protein [Metabacillus arenae]
MRNEKRLITNGKINKNLVLFGELKKDIKHTPCYKVILSNMKDSNDNLYAVVTPVKNMNSYYLLKEQQYLI